MEILLKKMLKFVVLAVVIACTLLGRAHETGRTKEIGIKQEKQSPQEFGSDGGYANLKWTPECCPKIKTCCPPMGATN